MISAVAVEVSTKPFNKLSIVLAVDRAMVELPEESVLQPKPAAAESSDSDSDSIDTSDLSDSEEEKINPPTSGSSNPGACAAAAVAGIEQRRVTCTTTSLCM